MGKMLLQKIEALMANKAVPLVLFSSHMHAHTYTQINTQVIEGNRKGAAGTTRFHCSGKELVTMVMLFLFLLDEQKVAAGRIY